MNIKQAAQESGLPVKTIRYYDDIGLINPPRDHNGYRDFRDNDLHKLTFVAQARSLGFTIEDCRTLLALYEDDARESADVKRIAKQHLFEIKAKIAKLNTMSDTLSHLINECAGDSRPDCPILDNFGKRDSDLN
ncbi:MAG: Cu(I)-responsive transcriptional regulator [Granulosicoccus sp.]